LRVAKRISIFSLLLLLIGCGAGGGNNGSSDPAHSQPSQAAMATGAWAAFATSQMGQGDSTILADISDQGGGQFFAGPNNVVVCPFQTQTAMNGFCFPALTQEGGGGALCCQYEMNITQSNAQVTITLLTITLLTINVTDTQLSPISTTTISGTLSTDGKSLTGTYQTTGQTTDSCKVTAQLNASLSGNYSGTLTSHTGQSFPITASITENADGSVSGNAVVSQSSCIATITFTPTGSVDHSFAIGGGMHIVSAADVNTYADVVPTPNGSN
jgi:hypothetical protein